MRRWNNLIVVATLALLPCCASLPPPAPPSAPKAPPPPPPLPPPPAANWKDAPLTPGGWNYRSGTANFGSGTAPALFTVQCERATRSIRLDRRLAAPATTSGTITVRTTFGDGQWPTAAADPAQPILTARVAAIDPALDKMAYSLGRFMIEASGTQALILPAWPEVARVIEDCRG